MKIKLSGAMVLTVIALLLAAPLFAAPPPVKPTVVQAADKITVTGGQAKKTVSDAFAMSKDAWYIIKSSYTGKDMSICQLTFVEAGQASGKRVSGDDFFVAIGPQTAGIVRGRGRFASGDYVIYADKASGPWTVEIIKNPKPAPLSTDKTFSGKASAVTPFFRLNKGTANFVIRQKQKSKIAMGIRVLLINADTGSQTADLIHNSLDPEFKIKKDIPAAGNYLLEVANAPEWDVSYSQ